MSNWRPASFCNRSKSLGDSTSVYDVTITGQSNETAARIVSGHVSKPLNPVDRYKPGLKKQTTHKEFK